MYVRTKVSVSKGQAEKVAKAIESGRSVTIRLSNSDLVGDHVIAVTQSQLNKIERARAQGVGIDLTLSKAQLKHNRSIEGGFIAAILPWLARAGTFLLSTVLPGLFSGAASAAGEKAVNAIANSASGSGFNDGIMRDVATLGDRFTNVFRQFAERNGRNRSRGGGDMDSTNAAGRVATAITNNPLLGNIVSNIGKAITGSGYIYVKNRGVGIKMRKVGNGLYLSPWKKHESINGAGLFLKPTGGSGYVDGSGLLFGPDSPVAKIPILGSLLGWLL